MSFKKFLSVLTASVLVLSLAGCGSDDPTINVPSSSAPASSVTSSAEDDTPEMQLALNPLTGEYTLDPAAEGKRPVAVMINNAAISVQSGLDSADVVYEVEVEGGITRLLAVFSDVSSVGKIGTIRSLRKPFAALACGMDAVLFYHGMDETHCRPYVKGLDLDYFEVDSTKYGGREKNGKAYEHTLYTSGEKLTKAITDKGYDMTGTTDTWLNFADKATLPSDTPAKRISVKLSGATTTNFIYDDTTGKYARSNKNDQAYLDYTSGEKELFTNIFVLNVSYSSCTSAECTYTHRFTDLSSGTGYYASAGGVVEINWTKGDAEDGFVFTDASGDPLTVNPGNSYICLKEKSRSVTFE